MRRLVAALRRIRGGRRVRPSRMASAALVAVFVSAVGGAGAFLHWALRSADPARTLALAGSVLARAPELDSALTVTWTWSVGGTDAFADRWLSLVAPRIPPGMCLPAPGAGPASADRGPADDGEGLLRAGAPSELHAALRRLDDAMRRWTSGAGAGRRDELERRLLAVRAAARAKPGSSTDLVVRYALGRGYAAAGDHATAADLLEPLLKGRIAPDRVPEADRRRAGELVSAGRVDETLALEAFYGRYLAGTVAYRRGEPGRAVVLFRRAINAVNYLLAVRAAGELGPEGHYERVMAGVGARRCPGAGREEPLTSLDAYAGLVAAYMADADFHDPAGLPDEVARTRLEIDPDDPLRPVLRHARATGGRRDRTPVPENLLWAASNLQRVYHYNRLRPDPRLEVTRAVLVLRLTGDPSWTGALEAEGDADVCGMLASLGEDLRRDAAALELAGRAASPTDSARAAVAVQTFARLERECAGKESPAVEPPVRSAWIRLGGGYLTRGLAGRYEGIRLELRGALAAAGASPRVVEERLRSPVERVRTHRRTLARGRVPPEMPADLPVAPVRRFVDEWWTAVFAEVAHALVDEVRRSGQDGGTRIRAGEVPALLTALESAAAHARLPLGEVHAGGELARLAGTGGNRARWRWRLRTAVRARPLVAAGVLGGLVLGVTVLALLAHVSWWRYRLFTSKRFYVAELRSRQGRA